MDVEAKCATFSLIFIIKSSELGERREKSSSTTHCMLCPEFGLAIDQSMISRIESCLQRVEGRSIDGRIYRSERNTPITAKDRGNIEKSSSTTLCSEFGLAIDQPMISRIKSCLQRVKVSTGGAASGSINQKGTHKKPDRENIEKQKHRHKSSLKDLSNKITSVLTMGPKIKGEEKILNRK